MAGTGGGGGVGEVSHRPAGWGDSHDGKRHLVLRGDGDEPGLPSMKTGVMGRPDEVGMGLCALYLPKTTYVVKYDGIPLGYFRLEKNYDSEVNGLVLPFCSCMQEDIVIPPAAFDGKYSSHSETTSNQIYCQVFSPILEGESVRDIIAGGVNANVRNVAAMECGVEMYVPGTTDYTPQFKDCLDYYVTGNEPVKQYGDLGQEESVKEFCAFVRSWNEAMEEGVGEAVMSSDAEAYFVSDDTFRKVQSDDGVKYERMDGSKKISTHVIPIGRILHDRYFGPYLKNWNVYFDEVPGSGGRREFRYLAHESLDVAKEVLGYSSSVTDIGDGRNVKYAGGRFSTWYTWYNDAGTWGVENTQERDFAPGIGELRIYFKVPVTSTSMTRLGGLGFSGSTIIGRNTMFDVRKDIESPSGEEWKSEVWMEARLLLRYNVRTLEVEGVVGPSDTWSTTIDEQVDRHETVPWSPDAVLRGWTRHDVVYPKGLWSHITVEKLFR